MTSPEFAVPTTEDSAPAAAAKTSPAVSSGREYERARRETNRRRTFAIISHPDAGKTTLTEKFLLYAGQVSEAGAVRGRKTQRAARSDWMQMERERGISIKSTVLSFEYRGFVLNLLDTPGHDDFSEDTYRTLTAADCAVMVIDAVKGIETQTKKLFKICADRKIPILTFVNKMDRPGCDPLKTLSDIEEVLGIHAVPINWPIGTGYNFRGVFDRPTQKVLLFKPTPHGAVKVPTQEATLDDIGETLLEETLITQLKDEIELLNHAGETFSSEAFLNGQMTPVYFGSALTNFGVEPFLNSFLDLSPAPTTRLSDHGPVPTDAAQFSGVIFKIQANLDPKHHDRVAFLRVCAGKFTRDMELLNARTGASIRIKRSHRSFAQERETVDEAWPGDILGLVIPGQFCLGDTLCEGERLQYAGRWQFPPECFASLRCADTLRRKQFQQGLLQLREEGAIQIFTDSQLMAAEPLLGAVGELQFEVVQYRLESEYKVKTVLHRLPYTIARWVTGTPEELEAIRVPSSCRQLFDEAGNTVLVFESTWSADYCRTLNPKLPFLEAAP